MGEGEGKASSWRGVAIAGPTASGKSKLALDLAKRFDGVVINADAMQVYADLRVLTARPSPDDESQAPHRLYGVIDGAEACSARSWAKRAAQEIAAAREAGKLPILVGGTGLYFRALFEGLAALPVIPDDVRSYWRERATLDGAAALHGELASRDPAMAARLRPSDTQRLTRALEVIEATGRSLLSFQNEATEGGEEASGWKRVVLTLDRALLKQRIAFRARRMMAEGAADEVTRLIARALALDLPVMKAIGVPELAAALRGEMSFEAAAEDLIASTSRYAKRQTTWFRTQMAGWEQDTPETLAGLLA